MTLSFEFLLLSKIVHMHGGTIWIFVEKQQWLFTIWTNFKTHFNKSGFKIFFLLIYNIICELWLKHRLKILPEKNHLKLYAKKSL